MGGRGFFTPYFQENMFLKIKDSVSIIYRKKGKDFEVNFLLNSSGAVIPYILSEAAFQCLRHLDGSHTIRDIAKLTSLSAKEVYRLVSVLRKAKVLASEGKIQILRKRFLNQLNYLADYETTSLSREKLQNRLVSATVVIIGLGGIGSWVANGLALAGISSFVLVDPDIVEEGNLNRQALYGMADIGMPKIEVAAHRLRTLYEVGQLLLHKTRIIDSKKCLKLIKGAQLVINCADDPGTDEINRIVTSACYPEGIPHILCGGYDGHLGFLGPTVVPPKSPCWYCYEASVDKNLKKAGYKHLKITQAHIQGGSIGAVCAIVANYHVLEAIKVLSGCSAPALFNKGAELDFLKLSIHFREYKKRPSCYYCGTKRRNR